MDAIDQEWYDVVMTGRDQEDTLNDRYYDLFSQTGQNANTASSLHYPTNTDLLADMFTLPDLPPSLRAAAADVRLVPTYPYSTRYLAVTENAHSNDTSDQAAASAPLSFHNRSLQLALPQMQYEVQGFPDDAFPAALSLSARADSAIGGYDEISIFEGFEDSRLDTSSVERRDERTPRPDPLQYHLIQTKSSRVHFKDSAPTPTPPHNRSEAAPRSSVSNDNRTLSCHLCTDKHYTGVWAQRNLSRHMESFHGPCSSPNGVRQIRCSYGDCDRTFRREDARLVHERRSHPELNRPPPTKRKRSGEL